MVFPTPSKRHALLGFSRIASEDQRHTSQRLHVDQINLRGSRSPSKTTNDRRKHMKTPTNRQIKRFMQARGIPQFVWGQMFAEGKLTPAEFLQMVQAFHDPANKEHREELEYEMATNRH
mgnify:CR=1 FL=1